MPRSIPLTDSRSIVASTDSIPCVTVPMAFVSCRSDAWRWRRFGGAVARRTFPVQFVSYQSVSDFDCRVSLSLSC
jgi:hypothetical protein